MGRLYILPPIHILPQPTITSAATLSTNAKPVKHSIFACNETLDTWHNRLEHASPHTLQHLPFLKSLCIDFLHRSMHGCETCHKSKQHRLSFPSSAIQTVDYFELLHINIWGPYNQFSITNTPYTLTLVVDFSRATWVFLLSHKNQTPKLPNSWKVLSKWCRHNLTNLLKPSELIMALSSLGMIISLCSKVVGYCTKRLIPIHPTEWGG